MRASQRICGHHALGVVGSVGRGVGIPSGKNAISGADAGALSMPRKLILIAVLANAAARRVVVVGAGWGGLGAAQAL